MIIIPPEIIIVIVFQKFLPVIFMCRYEIGLVRIPDPDGPRMVSRQDEAGAARVPLKVMKESKKSKNRSDFNGRENLKLKKLKEKSVLKSKEMLKKDKDLT